VEGHGFQVQENFSQGSDGYYSGLQRIGIDNMKQMACPRFLF